jgi:uncharacterized membrane protein
MYHTPGLKQILAYANMLIHQKPETCHFLNNFVFSVCSLNCAEYHCKPLRKLLSQYIYETSGKEIDFSNRSDLFDALQKNTHIVAQYFNKLAQSGSDRPSSMALCNKL